MFFVTAVLEISYTA